MRVGYARVSTTEQSIDAQLERLADCEKVFHEKLSGKKDDRPELARALEFVREGDALVVTRLDRLARSVNHLCSIAEILRTKDVELQVLDQAIDTTTPAGKFLFHMLAAVERQDRPARRDGGDMIPAPIRCPRCNGRGIITGAVDLSMRTCWMCHGRGRLSPRQVAQWRKSAIGAGYMPPKKVT